MDRCAVGGLRDPLVAGLEPSADCPSAATQYVEVRKLINNKIIMIAHYFLFGDDTSRHTLSRQCEREEMFACFNLHGQSIAVLVQQHNAIRAVRILGCTNSNIAWLIAFGSDTRRA